MKRIVIIVASLLLSALSASAQGKVYCEILGTQKFLSTKVTITVDFGQERKFFGDNRLVDADGKVQEFNSMVDAMNYMGTLGWEFEQAYVVTMGSGAGASNVYHWLLSKFVGEDGDPNAIKTRQILNDEERAAAAKAAEAAEAAKEGSGDLFN